MQSMKSGLKKKLISSFSRTSETENPTHTIQLSIVASPRFEDLSLALLRLSAHDVILLARPNSIQK